MDRLTYHTVKNKISIEISSDKKTIAIFRQKSNEETSKKLAEFGIEYIWDMLKDALSTLDVEPEKAGLFRRKNEAQAAKDYTFNYCRRSCKLMEEN